MGKESCWFVMEKKSVVKKNNNKKIQFHIEFYPN